MSAFKFSCFWLLLIFQLINCSLSDPITLTLIHTNDVHSRFQQVNGAGVTCSENESLRKLCFGGFARLFHKAEEIRRTHRNVLYLSGGDYYQGTVWYTLYKWEIVSHFVNKLNHTAMAFGNHEFDDGVTGLLPFLDRATFPIISANVDASKEPLLKDKFKKSIVVEYEGWKIGIVGYTTEETMEISNPGKTLFFKNVTVSVAEEAKRLYEKEGIRIIIAVGHAGFEADIEVAKLPYIDLVVGGHTNTFLYNGSAPHTEIPEDQYPRLVRSSDGRRLVPVVQAFAYGKYMGYLNLTFNDAGDLTHWSGNPILLDYTVPQDPAMLADVLSWERKVNERIKVEVGRTRVLLDGNRLTCRRGECSMGNLVADSMVFSYLKFANTDYWAEVSLALVHSGSIRVSVDEKAKNGSVSMEDVLAIQPFGHTIDLVSILGKHLKQVFEFSVEGYDPTYFDPSGKFLQVSGFRIVYDLSKPSGNRVRKIDVLCQKCRIPTYVPLEDNEIYQVVVPGYLVAGGGGFDVLKKNAFDHQTTGTLDIDVLLEYFQMRNPVIQGLDGRISFESDADVVKHCESILKPDYLKTKDVTDYPFIQSFNESSYRNYTDSPYFNFSMPAYENSYDNQTEFEEEVLTDPIIQNTSISSAEVVLNYYPKGNRSTVSLQLNNGTEYTDDDWN